MGDDRSGVFETGKNHQAQDFPYTHGLTNNYGVAEKFGKLR